jgi:hypothetical protein
MTSTPALSYSGNAFADLVGTIHLAPHKVAIVARHAEHLAGNQHPWLWDQTVINAFLQSQIDLAPSMSFPPANAFRLLFFSWSSEHPFFCCVISNRQFAGQ